LNDSNLENLSKAELIEALEHCRQREVLFDATESAAHIGHYEWDYEKDCLRSCSEEFARLYGMTVEEAIATLSSWGNSIEFIHQDDRESYQSHARSSRQTGLFDLKYRIISRDSKVRHVHEVGVIIADDKSRNQGSLGIVQDISELVKRQHDIEYRAALIKQAEEITDLGYYNFDLETEKYHYISPGFARIHGVSPEEYLRKVNSRDEDMADVYPDDYVRLDREYCEHRINGSRINIDYRIIREDGEVRWIRELGKLLCSSDGSKRQSLGVLQDITQQKQYEQGLESRDLLAQQAESITDIGHFIYDEKAEMYQYLSPGFARIYGCSVGDFMDKFQSISAISCLRP
jgi:PAS domain S-box-containing protein